MACNFPVVFGSPLPSPLFWWRLVPSCWAGTTVWCLLPVSGMPVRCCCWLGPQPQCHQQTWWWRSDCCRLCNHVCICCRAASLLLIINCLHQRIKIRERGGEGEGGRGSLSGLRSPQGPVWASSLPPPPPPPSHLLHRPRPTSKVLLTKLTTTTIYFQNDLLTY